MACGDGGVRAMHRVACGDGGVRAMHRVMVGSELYTVWDAAVIIDSIVNR